MAITALEQLEQAKKRMESANARRNQVQGRLEAARQQYAEAVREAEAAHGTSDLPKLREILAKQEADNTAAIAEFVRAVDDFDSYITRIERALADPEAMNALLVTMTPVAAPAPVVDEAPKAKAATVQFNEDDI